MSSKYGTLPALKEPPNALALVLNLQHVDVKSSLEKLQGTFTVILNHALATTTSFIDHQ
jgi:hypothetical protein